MVRTRELPNKTTTETAYYLLSAPLSAERFGNAARSHWGVENRLHWCLDVVMNEDHQKPLGQRPSQSCRLAHMALNVMRKDNTKASLRGKFKLAGWKDDYLANLLAQF
jgi:predicted transposase YbfD/YdcC